MQFNPQSKPQINVGQGERLASTVGGAALLALALSRRSAGSLPLALGAGYLLYRGLSGKDFIYDLLDIDRAVRFGQEGIEVERALTIHRPRPEVYEFWRALENLPRFMDHIKDIERLADGGKRSHWVVKGPLDSNVEWDAEIYEEKENELISWRSLPGSEVEHRGTIRFKDAPGGRGTEVYVRLVYNPPAGSAGAAFAKLFGEEPYQQIREDLRRFKQIMEAGETATTLGQTSARVEEVERQREEIRRRRRKDLVQEASEESFPASDAPAWTSGPA
jgi:uncharacterized membrane protein